MKKSGSKGCRAFGNGGGLLGIRDERCAESLIASFVWSIRCSNVIG